MTGDAEIVEKVLGGDTEAFSAIVDRYGDGVLRLAGRIVGNSDMARDITQEVMVKVWRSLRKWRGDSSLSTWIFRIAYNASVSHLRKHRPTADIDAMQLPSADDDELTQEARHAALEQALSSLAPDDRALVTLFYGDDRSVADIAKIMGLGESNVKVRLHRVRKKLQKIINTP